MDNTNVLTLVSIASGAIAMVPISVIVDEFLQHGNVRISKIANTRILDEQGEVFAYIAKPANIDEPAPTVMLVHQFFGLRPRDTDLCDELARLGYVAIAPDCYQGNTTSLIPRAISLVRKISRTDNYDLPLQDFHRVLTYAESLPYVDKNKIAAVGFCFGGGVALRYGDQNPQKVKAIGIFYGKPLLSLSQLKAPIYGVYGNKDIQFPPPLVNKFESIKVKKNIFKSIA